MELKKSSNVVSPKLAKICAISSVVLFRLGLQASIIIDYCENCEIRDELTKTTLRKLIRYKHYNNRTRVCLYRHRNSKKFKFYNRTIESAKQFGY